MTRLIPWLDAHLDRALCVGLFLIAVYAALWCLHEGSVLVALAFAGGAVGLFGAVFGTPVSALSTLEQGGEDLGR